MLLCYLVFSFRRKYLMLSVSYCVLLPEICDTLYKERKHITVFPNFISVLRLEKYTLFERILLHAYYVMKFKSKYWNRFHQEISILHRSALVTLWKVFLWKKIFHNFVDGMHVDNEGKLYMTCLSKRCIQGKYQ